MIIPATRRADDSPVPAHMLTGNRAKVDIPKGTIITYSMVEQPHNSVLWDLRLKQEHLFS